MFIKVTKLHKSNKGRTLRVCRYGYFRKDKGWELIAINLFGKSLFIYRSKEYHLKWPVACG